jgi:hypothetical protein
MIRNFEFSLAIPYEMVRREASGIMLPTIAEEFEKGVQLPFKIRLVEPEF